MDDILIANDKLSDTTLICLDLSKALDNINHELLLSIPRLEDISNYLSNIL